jgi:hypothetical protein
LGHLVERPLVAVNTILRVTAAVTAAKLKCQSLATYLVNPDFSVSLVVDFLFVQSLPVLNLIQSHLLLDIVANGPDIRNVAEPMHSDVFTRLCRGKLVDIIWIVRLNLLRACLGWIQTCYLPALQGIHQRDLSVSSIVDALNLLKLLNLH